MSVYTQLSVEDVQIFASQYALSVETISPIQGGIENTNYFVSLATQQQLVLTVFEELNQHEAGVLIPVLQHLAQHAIPVANPLTALNGQTILSLANKPAQLAPRLVGTHPMQPTLLQVARMGEGLARIHRALNGYDLTRESNHGQAWWQATAEEMRTLMQDDDKQLLNTVFAVFTQAQQHYPDRQIGLIHGDLFRDNTLFVDEDLTGVLDFSELSNDELLLDIAICMNDFCSDWPHVALDHNKARQFIQAYQVVNPLTSDELKLLPMYLAMAACRFWLSRLQVAQRNHAEDRAGEHVLQKNPDEMRQMLVDRLKQKLTL
jgi:homoserine kinase type II